MWGSKSDMEIYFKSDQEQVSNKSNLIWKPALTVKNWLILGKASL